jgi:hypothetical protein
MKPAVLLIACGALARELVQIVRLSHWSQIRVRCLSPALHQEPHKIPAAVRAELEKSLGRYERIFVAYGDCGTGGKLDEVLDEFGIERLPGSHCYEVYAGAENFREIAESEPGTFYLTDFLVRHFERLIFRGLGLDERPELKELYFGNYRRLVYLAQTDDPELQKLASEYAASLGLEYEYHFTGSRQIEERLKEQFVRWQGRPRTQESTHD